MKFHHVALISRDKHRALEFYVQKLGFSLIKETYREDRRSWKLDLEREDMRLEIFTFPRAPARASWPENEGLRHLAFTDAHLEAWHLKLKGLGVKVEDIRTDELTGKKFFFFFDPDEQPLEFYQS